MEGAHFFSIIYNEVTTLDIYNWISIDTHTYDKWTWVPMHLSLEQVVDGSNSNIMTWDMVQAIKTYVGMEGLEYDVQLTYFGASVFPSSISFSFNLAFVFNCFLALH